MTEKKNSSVLKSTSVVERKKPSELIGGLGS
jgi:hypothetical protein